MARTDNDTWDLASSVGATATMVAAARALASSAKHSLPPFDDEDMAGFADVRYVSGVLAGGSR